MVSIKVTSLTLTYHHCFLTPLADVLSQNWGLQTYTGLHSGSFDIESRHLLFILLLDILGSDFSLSFLNTVCIEH